MKTLVITKLPNGQYAIHRSLEPAVLDLTDIISVRDDLGRRTYSNPNSVADDIILHFEALEKEEAAAKLAANPPPETA